MGADGKGEGRAVTEPETRTFLKCMAQERRQGSHLRLQARLPLRLPVIVELRDSPAEVPIVGVTENLSRGGVLLRVARAAHPGTALQVTLYIRRSTSLALTGTVVWTAPDPDPPGWKLGVQFGEELPVAIVAQIAEDAFPPGGVRSQ